MAVKVIDNDGIGAVHLYNRRGAKHIGLSIAGNGQIRVTMPNWMPYSAVTAFAKQKADWLRIQAKPPLLLHDGMSIGKKHRLRFEIADTATVVKTRLSDDLVIVKLPAGVSTESEAAQAAALKVSVRALKQEAEAFLPGRLRQL